MGFGFSLESWALGFGAEGSGLFWGLGFSVLGSYRVWGRGVFGFRVSVLAFWVRFGFPCVLGTGWGGGRIGGLLGLTPRTLTSKGQSQGVDQALGLTCDPKYLYPKPKP